jgi:DNA-binding NtrC family response regulator
VVEDEESLGKMVQKMLSAMAYRVDYSSSSQRALKRFQDGEAFDLVISDVVMPHMNGKELSDAILKINPQQKILFMSGFADDVIAQHGILDPSQPFIQKPFSARQIAPLIYKLVSASQQNLKLLILDDEEGICKLFQRSCERRGHICDKACAMTTALQLISKNKYDMLLVDMNLNELSGSEAIQAIRERACDTPIILLSGMIQPGTLDGLGDRGVIRAFEKSFDNTPILQFIENYIQKQRDGIVS